MSDEIERTTPLGLFNYARSYWRSAEYLHAAQLTLTHPTAPVSFLFYHAIELYLKDFLLSQSMTLSKALAPASPSVLQYPFHTNQGASNEGLPNRG